LAGRRKVGERDVYAAAAPLCVACGDFSEGRFGRDQHYVVWDAVLLNDFRKRFGLSGHRLRRLSDEMFNPRERVLDPALKMCAGLCPERARLAGSVSRMGYNPASGETCTMKKTSKTAAELEASIKVEMEDICDWPTDMTISVQPNGDSWKVKVVQEGSVDDADRREMVEQIAARLKGEYDLKG
jgi:hypothetical protein